MPAIRDIMTKNPVTCSIDASLRDVAQKMIDADTGFIPLMDNNKLTAVVTDRDITVRGIAKGLGPDAKVRDVSTPAHEEVSPDCTIEEAAKRMQNWHIRRLIVSDKGRPVGVVSLGDLAEAMGERAQDVLVEVSKSAKTMKKQNT